MSELNERIAALTPEQRAIFDLLRKKQPKKPAAAAPPSGPIPRRPVGGPAPLSFDQERLWFLHQLDPLDAAYNIFALTALRGRLDVPRLTAAVNEVVRRHEAWRTCFPAVDGRPVQAVLPHLELRPPVVDLRALPETVRRQASLGIARQEKARPFDLERGPLVRALLIHLGDEELFCQLTVHHIVSDWASFQIAWGEIAALYAAFREGEPSPLPELPIQYADFTVWQREWMQGETLQAYLDFWLREIEGAPLVLELPTDRPRPAFLTTRGAQPPVVVSLAETDALRGVARREGVTTFMALLGVYAALLHRLTGEEKLLVSSQNANRGRPEVQGLLGFFLTQLVLATDLAENPAFRELLRRVRGTAIRAFGHQDLPFGKLVEAVRPERDPSRAPLVQVSLQVLDAEYSEFVLPGLTAESVKLEDEAALFDLSLTLWESSRGITGTLEHNLDLFDATTGLRLARAFESLIAQVGRDPEVRVSELRLLSGGAIHQILAEWNDTAVPEPAPRVDRLVEEQAARTPDAVALATPDGEVTYRELVSRAGQLAAWLQSQGIGPEARVGLCVERTADVAVGMLGIWQAGAAWVPLDPGYPADRLAFILEDAGLAAVVTRDRPASRLPAFSNPLLSLDRLEQAPPSPGRVGGDGRGAGGEGLAYVIYTSGTTGRPKGVMVEHGNLAHVLRASRREFGWNERDRIPALAPFSFDIFLFELWSPLTAGGTCELVPLSPALDLPALMAALERSTRLHAVPALMRQIVALGRAEGRRWPGIRTLFVGGDAVPPELLADLPEVFPSAEIRVLYGPTEGTIICASFRANEIPWPDRGPKAMLGRPLPDAEIRLVERSGGLAAIGVPGELWIGGPGVTRGYLGREELTAEKYPERDGRRWYRTGDLARRLPDGLLEFLGRADDQVKVRGFRIEPGEIESALVEHPAVREAVVLAVPVEGGDKRLVAWVVPEGGPWEESEDAVRAALARRLPEHMVPGAFVALAELPLTAHGKVDRRELLRSGTAAAPVAGGASEGGDTTAPRTPEEETLAEIWGGLLGVERVGVHDNFFRLGGDSILGIQVVARARQAGLVITPRQIFENQTVAALAAVARPVAEAMDTTEDEGPVTGEARLTPVQLRFLQGLSEDGPADPEWFDQALLLEARDPLEAGRLAAALAVLAERHDALRLRFGPHPPAPSPAPPRPLPGRGGDWQSAFLPPLPGRVGGVAGEGGRGGEGWAEGFPLSLIDLSPLPETIPEPDLRALLEAACAQVHQSFDLAEGPLARAALFELGPGRPQRLLLAIHHLVVDAVSWRILLEDLQAAYGQLALPSRTTSWKRWTERLTAHARSMALRRELGFWRSVPAPAPLPVDLPGTPEEDTVGAEASVAVELPAELTAALLREAPAAWHARTDDLLLAALAMAFSQWTGDGRLVLDLEGHGREEIGSGIDRIDLTRTVGWFTTVYPVALDLSGTRGPGGVIRTVKEQLRAVPGRGLGYGLLRYVVGDRALARRPDPEVGFNYLGQVDAVLSAAGSLAPASESAGPSRSPRARRAHRIEVDALVHEGRLRVGIAYGSRLFTRETMERLAAGLGAALRELIAHSISPGGPEGGGWTPSDFPLARFDQAALDRLLGRHPAIEDVYPLAPLQSGMLFHSLYAAGSEIYFEQLACTLRGPLDVAAFARAWQAVEDREPVLRTAFAWEGLERPLQVVRRSVEVPWVLEDWRGEADPSGRLRAYAAADRARGFDLARGPLMRVALLRTGEAEHRLLWSFHHLLFDGWCFSLLFGAVFTLYEAFRRGQTAALGPAPAYRDYIAWLERQDPARAEAFWRARLAGASVPTPVPMDDPQAEGGRAAADFQDVEIDLPPALADALGRLARDGGLTLNTLVQGAWALLVARWSGRRDVTFGAIAAGRPADLPGVESMVGLFINTLPVRVAADPKAPVLDWLRRLQEEQVEQRAFEHTPLADVQRWSGTPGAPLFHSLLVFENYPVDPSVGNRLAELEIADVEVSERTNYALTLAAVVRDSFMLRLSVDRRVAPETAGRMLVQLQAVLAAFVEEPGRALGSIPVLPGEDELRDRAASSLVVESVSEVHAAEPPRGPVEEALVRVWRSVLRLERIGIRDDFFRLGGDSILSLQIVARARQEGIALTPRQIFENPTIASLAAVAGLVVERAEEEQAEGAVPLTPIQRFFLKQRLPESHWFNQSLLLAARGPVDAEVLAQAVAVLPERHDALRWRLDGDNAFVQATDALPLIRIDLSGGAETVEQACARLQTGFDLQRGPLFVAALLATPAGPRLFLAAHHLVVDAVSWRILLEDLEIAYGQIAAGEPVHLPARTTSWKRWAERLAEHARTEEVREELAFWLSAPSAAPLPVDRPEGENTVGALASVTVELSPESTEALLRRAPAAWHTRVDDLLLAALARTVARWTGGARVRIDLEGHGREEIAPGIDLSRTVGWFTAIHPVTIDLTGAEAPGEAIRTVKEQLRAVPHHGLGWGLLRWLGDREESERLAALPPAEIAFNNLGQLDNALGPAGRWEPAPEASGLPQSPRGERGHLFEVNAMVLDGRLRVDWGYAGRHDRATIQRLAEGFRAELEGLIDVCLQPGAGGWTPSDFPLAGLGQAALDAVSGNNPGLEDLYPIAPLQRGMLLHGLYAPDSELYLEQLSCVLHGPLETEAFQRAWQRVVDRHPALRTAFAWRGLDEPLQAVRRGVELPWAGEDWRALPDEERSTRWRERVAADGRRTFDLERPPLQRALLVRTEEDEHRFLWTFHHMLFDGWCFSLIFREVFALYEGFRRGEEPRLPEPRPYRDFIAWLRDRPSGRSEAWWRQRLDGFSAANPLPVDLPSALPGDPAASEPGERELRLSAPATAALEAFAQGRRLTLNTLFQGAWALLLSRYGAGQDVVFGSVVAGRPPELPGVESMVGLFINTLPLRLDVDPEAAAAAWLAGVQEAQLDLRPHEHVPLATIQGWSGLPPGEPLFRSLAVFENYPFDESLAAGARELEVRDLVVADRADLPLSAVALPGGSGLVLRMSHDHQTEPATADRLLRSLETLLTGLAADADRPLRDIPLLTGAEREQTLAWAEEGWRVEETERDLCIHELFARRAAERPEAVAVLDMDGTAEVSYGELARRAGRLAGLLRKLGVGPEARVGVWLERSPRMIEALLAVHAAGGAYVPIDPETPPERTAFLLEDSGALLLLTQSSLAASLPAVGARVMRLDEETERIAARPEARSENDLGIVDASPDHLAYVLYTSGSTGLPKGVLVTHRSLAAFTRAVRGVYGLGPADRVVQFASLSFDTSMEEIFCTLTAGGSLAVRSGLVEDAATFLRRCGALGVTWISLPTAYWHQLAAVLEEGREESPAGLRLVIIGGERALPERWAAWGRGPGARARLLNSYGPTEATIVATVEEHPGGTLPARREVPIGRPIAGWRAHVLDAGLQPLPVGASGELLLGGVGLARGYLGDPARTAERFIPDPFGPSGERLYRTGDRARRLPDGRLEFAGRIDTQVKVRGFRVELGEIEAALVAHPQVRDAAVATRADASGNLRLIGFVVWRAESIADPESLQAALQRRLPAWMVPSDIVALPLLPVTTAGKVDRRALARMTPERGGDREIRAPRNPVEEGLAAIWSELLGVERIGLDDDFFALGGHSLLATQLVSRVRRRFGVDLPLHGLFELRTLEDLSREVLSRTLDEGGEGENMDRLLAELDDLSDEEALALLAAEEGGDAP
jgi:amino acid adenylation domain-containing protein/non-ribosomal peptide synthase protein (TIGR01720 family)